MNMSEFDKEYKKKQIDSQIEMKKTIKKFKAQEENSNVSDNVGEKEKCYLFNKCNNFFKDDTCDNEMQQTDDCYEK